jgi:hypothetical protein
MTALFIVRAVVADAGEREAFDRWYEQEHLPQAAAASRQSELGAVGARSIRRSTTPSTTNFLTFRLLR